MRVSLVISKSSAVGPLAFLRLKSYPTGDGQVIAGRVVTTLAAALLITTPGPCLAIAALVATAAFPDTALSAQVTMHLLTQGQLTEVSRVSAAAFGTEAAADVPREATHYHRSTAAGWQTTAAEQRGLHAAVDRVCCLKVLTDTAVE